MADQRLVRLIEGVLSTIKGQRIATETARRLADEIVGDGYERKDAHAEIERLRNLVREVCYLAGMGRHREAGELLHDEVYPEINDNEHRQ